MHRRKPYPAPDHAAVHRRYRRVLSSSPPGMIRNMPRVLLLAASKLASRLKRFQFHRCCEEEPLLNPHILRCFRVPDGSADSFLAADLNVASARQYGAQVSYLSPGKPPAGKQRARRTRVIGRQLPDLVKDEEVQSMADLVINACWRLGWENRRHGRISRCRYSPAKAPWWR